MFFGGVELVFKEEKKEQKLYEILYEGAVILALLFKQKLFGIHYFNRISGVEL